MIKYILATLLLASCATTYKTNNVYELKRNISYSDKASSLTADLWIPKNKNLSTPAIVVVHGGGWTGRTRDDMNEISEKLASSGFAVMNISYRLAPKDHFPKAIIDYLNAVQWLKKNAKTYNIDPKKIGAFGYSAGAHIVSLGSLLKSDNLRDQKIFGKENLIDANVHAVVAGGAPMDLVMSKDSDLVQTFLGKKYNEDSELYRNASPVFYVHPKSPPFFLYHGQNDWIVTKEHMNRMIAEFDKNKVKYKTYIVPVVGHIASFLWSSDSVNLSIDFLNENLRS